MTLFQPFHMSQTTAVRSAYTEPVTHVQAFHIKYEIHLTH